MRPFFDPAFEAPETSAKLVFSGGTIDRLSEERSADCIAEALADPKVRLWGMVPGRVLLEMDDVPRGLFALNELEPFAPKMDRAVLLGFDHAAPRLAVSLGIKPDADGNFDLPEPFKVIDHRSIANQGLLPHDELGQVAYGTSLLSWHGINKFCAACGNPSNMADGGAKRICPSCSKEHFPRTDPVVIMLTVSGDKCLLGRSHHFPPGMYSALAGFVEPGETLENAVRRETFEESGIRVGKVSYHASQPWPFPHSLMIGCYGEALDETIDMDQAELDDCRWFTREEMRTIVNGEGPVKDDGTPEFFTPPTMAIARRLVDDWIA